METLGALHRLKQLESQASQYSFTADDMHRDSYTADDNCMHRDATPCSPHQPTSPYFHTQVSLSGVNGLGLNNCKRRIDFGNNSLQFTRHPSQQQLKMRVGRGKYQTPAVLRRNERERNRVRMVNTGFNTLRQHVPQVADNKKVSKVDTLRAAVDYIKQLQQLLGKEDLTETLSDVASFASSKTTSCKTLSSCSSSPASDRTATSSPTDYSSDSAHSADDDAFDTRAYENDLADLAGWLQ